MWYLPYPRPQNGWPLGWSIVKDSLLLGKVWSIESAWVFPRAPEPFFPAYSKQTSLLTQPSVRGDSSGIKPSFSQLKLLFLMLNRPNQGAFIVCHCIILNHFHVFVQWKDKQKQMLIIRNPTPRAVTRYLSNHSCSLILRGKSGWKQTTWLVNPHCGMSKLGICNPNHHFMFHLFTLSVIGGFCSIVVLCFVCNVFFGGAMEH